MNTVYGGSSGVAGGCGGLQLTCRSVRSTVVAQVLGVDERLAAHVAREPSLTTVSSAHVRLHIMVPGEGLAADGTDNTAGVLTPVICAFPRSLDLLAALPTFVHVPIDVQSVMFIKISAADESATANFTLERSVAGVPTTMDRQQIGAHERPSA